MSGGNFFKIDRAIFEHSIWQDPVQFRIFFYLVGKAVWLQEGLVKGNVHIKRGQFLLSYRRMRDELEFIENNALKKYSLSRIHRAIEKLEAAEMIKKHETELGTLFEVVNYEKYQGSQESEIDTKNATWNEDGTQMEQQRNNNKKEKNDKNEKNYEEEAATISDREVFDFYQQNLQAGITESPFLLEKISHWIADLSPEVVLEAMKEQAFRELKGFAYAEKVLKNWTERKITSLEAIKKMRDERERSKAGPYKNRSNKRKEPVPTWLAKEPESPKESSEANIDQERERLQQKLKEYRAAQN